MTLLTALEIHGNYPDNILIESSKQKDGEKWTSAMYMTRDGSIHKVMLSYDGFPFDSSDEAEKSMKDLAESAIEYVNNEWAEK